VAWPLRRLEAYRSGLPVVCINVGREYKFCSNAMTSRRLSAANAVITISNRLWKLGSWEAQSKQEFETTGVARSCKTPIITRFLSYSFKRALPFELDAAVDPLHSARDP